jgi:putative polyketide hydroxylase
LTDNAFVTRYQIGDDGAVLVRPDGYVAWRSGTAHPDGSPLVHAVERILVRDLSHAISSGTIY